MAGKAGEVMTGFTEKQRKALLTAGVTAAVYLSFKFILPLFLPFLISYLIALILRPSANFLERKLRVKRRGKTYAVPIGVIGGIEMILILALLGAGFFYGGRGGFFGGEDKQAVYGGEPTRQRCSRLGAEFR